MVSPSSALPPLPPADATLAEFVTRLARLVLAEASATRERIERSWALPLSERVAAGRAIAGINVGMRQPDGLLSLHCPRNESRFRAGDILCLSRGNPAVAPSFLVTLELDEETELLVSSEDPGLALQEFAAQPDGWVLDEGFIDLSGMLVGAIEQAADTAAGRSRILPLLSGELAPQLDLEREEYAHSRALGWGLNEQQAEALALAYASDLCYLIQGPPGTGKTLLLARLAQLLAADGERVLITAATHRAINNALNKLAELELRQDATPATIVKVGRAVRSDDLRVETYSTFDASPLPSLAGAYIVGATPFATRTNRLNGVEFDTVIFDEASQITLPLAIMGMLAGRRFVFVGDHRQLPPVLATHYGDQLLRDSVFGVLVDRGFDTMLEETYRLNSELAAWPGATFYAGRLFAAATAARRRIAYQRPPARLASILDPAEPQVFVDLGHRNITTRSDREASLAVDLIVEMLRCGIPAHEIGVVTPYRAQSRAIRGLLRHALPAAEQRRALVVDTVERMQGQEREVVIVSLTSSNPVFLSDLADFFFQPGRLNVAITRPRSKLILLGSRHMLDASPSSIAAQEWVLLFGDLIASCACRVSYAPG